MCGGAVSSDRSHSFSLGKASSVGSPIFNGAILILADSDRRFARLSRLWSVDHGQSVIRRTSPRFKKESQVRPSDGLRRKHFPHVATTFATNARDGGTPIFSCYHESRLAAVSIFIRFKAFAVFVPVIWLPGDQTIRDKS
jgi:hypothetical protein